MLGQTPAHKQQDHASDKRSSVLLHWPHRGGVSKDTSRSNHGTDDRSVRSTISQVSIFDLSAHGGDACSAADLLQLQQHQQQQQRPVLPPEVAASAQQLRGLLASTSFFQHNLQVDTAAAIRTVESATAGTTTAAAATAAAGAGQHPASAAMPVTAPVRHDSDARTSSSGAGGCMLAVDVALRLSCGRGYRVVLRRVLDSKAYWWVAVWTGLPFVLVYLGSCIR